MRCCVLCPHAEAVHWNRARHVVRYPRNNGIRVVETDSAAWQQHRGLGGHRPQRRYLFYQLVQPRVLRRRQHGGRRSMNTCNCTSTILYQPPDPSIAENACRYGLSHLGNSWLGITSKYRGRQLPDGRCQAFFSV